MGNCDDINSNLPENPWQLDAATKRNPQNLEEGLGFGGKKNPS